MRLGPFTFIFKKSEVLTKISWVTFGGLILTAAGMALADYRKLRSTVDENQNWSEKKSAERDGQFKFLVTKIENIEKSQDRTERDISQLREFLMGRPR